MRLLKFIPLLLAASLSTPVLADCQAVAKMVASDGQVSIKPAGKVLKVSPGPLPRPICAGDEVHTFEGRARIDDGRTQVTLDRFSIVAFNGVNKTGLNQGQALFEVKKRKAETGVEVRTRLSVIGVKGTRFLVSDKDAGVAVVLDRGIVDVTSTQGPISLYRETPGTKQTDGDDFEAYLKRKAEAIAAGQAAFEQYRSTVHREFVAYVESLTLEAGKELVTVGNMAVERAISSEYAQAIQALEGWQVQP